MLKMVEMQSEILRDEVVKKAEEITPDFIQSMYNKFGVKPIGCTSEQIATALNSTIVEMGVKPEFLSADHHLYFLIGLMEQILRTQDPIFQAKLQRELLLTLTGQMSGRELTDALSTLKIRAEKMVMPDSQLALYLAENMDVDSTEKVREPIDDQLAEITEIWKQKGLQLELEVTVVQKSQFGIFQQLFSGSAFIRRPNPRELRQADTQKPIKTRLVLLADETDNARFINHELDHLRHTFDALFTGDMGLLFGMLEELCTEYAAGNYVAGEQNARRTSLAYASAKDFWENIVIRIGVPFDSLNDRSLLLANLVQKVGFTGLAELAAVQQIGDGKGEIAHILERSATPSTKLIPLLEHAKQEIEKDANSITVDGDRLTLLSRYVNQERVFDGMERALQHDWEKYWCSDRFLSQEEMRILVNEYARALAVLEKVGNEPLTSDGEDGTVNELMQQVLLIHQNAGERTFQKYLRDYKHDIDNIGTVDKNYLIDAARILGDIGRANPLLSLALRLNNEQIKAPLIAQFVKTIRIAVADLKKHPKGNEVIEKLPQAIQRNIDLAVWADWFEENLPTWLGESTEASNIS